MKRETIKTILGAGAIIVAIVTGAIYLGRLEERVRQIEEGHQHTITVEGGAEKRRIEFANSGQWGRWSEPLFCGPNEFVCGLEQKVEPSSASDDTAMNAVAFYCCQLLLEGS